MGIGWAPRGGGTPPPFQYSPARAGARPITRDGPGGGGPAPHPRDLLERGGEGGRGSRGEGEGVQGGGVPPPLSERT